MVQLQYCGATPFTSHIQRPNSWPDIFQSVHRIFLLSMHAFESCSNSVFPDTFWLHLDLGH